MRHFSVAHRRVWAFGLAAGLVVIPGLPASAQTPDAASAPVVTAAFLINFAKFTEWPSDALAPDARLVVCVTDPAVGEALTVATAGHLVGDHPVSVMVVAPEPAPRGCSVLYASGLDRAHTAALVGALRNISVLSVGDSEEFTRSGGVMQLFVEDGRMRFAVNVAAAERARLRLSSKLLTLARIVKE